MRTIGQETNTASVRNGNEDFLERVCNYIPVTDSSPIHICDYCKKPFVGKRRFCKPSHKTLFFRMKKAAFLNDVLRRVAA